MTTVERLLDMAIERNASDVHIGTGMAPALRIAGNIVKLDMPPVPEVIIKEFIDQHWQETRQTDIDGIQELDLAVTYKNIRLRVHAYQNHLGWALAIRLLAQQIPTLQQLNLPPIFQKICAAKQGLVVITGPTGSGKSTTLAAMIEEINRSRPVNIITIEDPIEYIYQPKMALIQQREVQTHTQSFARALRAALREDPDVILVGEMRDLETIRAALEAAETGHLVFSTLHTNSAAETIDRIINVFPEYQQQQIRMMLADALVTVIAQRLIPAATPRGRVAVQEILVVNPAVRNLIRENKTFQIPSIIQTGSGMGMQTFQQHIQRYRQQGILRLEAGMEMNIGAGLGV